MSESTPLLAPREDILDQSTSKFIRTIIPFLLLQTSVGLCASLQATFYPIEAESKGATAAQFGAVFGIIHLSLFIFGPLVGKYLSVWGVRAIFPAGFIIDGTTFILFGLLQWVNDTTPFLLFSYLIRFLEGVGAAATWTSNLSILMALFPDRRSTVKAWCDASFNFGLTVGPVLGAFMYDAGGFFLPFAVTGSAILLSGCIVYFTIKFPDMESDEKCGTGVFTVLCNTRVLISLITCTVGAYSVGTIEATLSPFLEAMDFSVKKIAITFLVMSLSSVLATPLFGLLCDTAMSPFLVSASGSVLMFICFLFLGPVPYLASVLPPTSFGSVCGSLVAQGFGCAAVLVASFGSAQLGAILSGLPQSMEVQAVVSGLFTSAFAFGNFFGPTVSGVLYDVIGFEYNLLVLQGLVLSTFIVNLIGWLSVRNVETDGTVVEEDENERRRHDGDEEVGGSRQYGNGTSDGKSSNEGGDSGRGGSSLESTGYPELPADVIRSRPTNARPRANRPQGPRRYSTSSSVYERYSFL